MRYLSIVLEKLESRKQVNLKNYGWKHMTIPEAKRAAGIIETADLRAIAEQSKRECMAPVLDILPERTEQNKH